MQTNGRFGCVVLFLLLFFLSSNSIIAADSHNLDFSDMNSWEHNLNGGNILVNSNYIKLSTQTSVSTQFPFIRSINRVFPDYPSLKIIVDFKYLTAGNWGSGIALSPSDPQGNRTNIDSNIPNFVLFNIWQDTTSGFGIYSWMCEENQLTCELPIYINLNKTKPYFDFEQHSLSIEYSIDGKYTLYFDENPLPIFVSNQYQRKPYGMWIGHSVTTGEARSWGSFEVNKISFTELDSSLTPVIIIPGLGASWDVGAMLTGSENGDWKIPSFVSVYDGLKNSLVNAGYFDSGDNKNLFTFSYDWRKPLSALAERLNTYIETNISPGEKVNIVGHSMGGLVARAYAQTYGGSRINKIVTVGTPNMGAVSAYGPWEGAVALDDSWWSKIALELTTHFGFVMGESPVQTIQRLVPSLKDLLPTFDYISRNGSIVPWTSMNSKNEYLSGLNQNITSINPLTTAIFSTDVQTNSLIKVVSHTDGDLGSWVDGKPIENPFIKSDGDGTVTAMSSKGPFSNILQGSGWHGELVTKQNNIEKIFSILGLDTSKVLAGDYDTREGVFVAALRSPGSLEVCNINLTKCNNQLGIYLSDYKLFLLPGYDQEELVVKVKEGGLGLYKLHLGSVDETANWVVVSGEITKINQVDNYRVLSNQNDLVLGGIPNNKQNCKYDTWKLYSQLKFKNQGECVSFVERNEKARSKFFWWI